MNIYTRLLSPCDMQALISLEKKKWDDDQAASEGQLFERMRLYPEYCFGAFCNDTNQLLASLFLKPASPCIFAKQVTWYECVAEQKDTKIVNSQYAEWVKSSAFGISLSSVSAPAVDAVIAHYIHYALKQGITATYLGSPIPGYQRALRKCPELKAFDYAFKKQAKNNLAPYDPQLNYYYYKGFQKIVSVQESYFPHKKSLDYGVIIMGETSVIAESLVAAEKMNVLDNSYSRMPVKLPLNRVKGTQGEQENLQCRVCN